MKANKKTKKSGKKIKFIQVINKQVEVTIGRALTREGKKLEKEGKFIPKEHVIREEFTFKKPIYTTRKLENGRMLKKAA